MRHQKLLDRYVRFVGLNRSKATQEVHRTSLGPLLRGWGHLEPEGFALMEFEDYLAGKREGGSKPRTICILLTSCIGFIKWANERDIAVPNFVKDIKRPRVHRERPQIYKPEEVAKLLEACQISQRPMELVIALAYFVGMRRKEIKEADWSHVDWEHNQIQVIGSKVAKTRVLPISKKLRKILRSQWRNQKTGLIVL